MRWKLILGLLVACPTVASAQLRFTQPSVDLGELRGGAAAQHRFDFVNDGTTPIEIGEVRLGCGCLTATLEKRTLQPGEKGTLLMQLRTLGQPSGPRTWNAFVHYRQAGKQRESPILLAGKIVNEITVTPSVLAMSVDTTLRQEIVFTDQRTPPTARVIRARASTSALRVSPPMHQNGVTKIVIEVSRESMTKEREEATLELYTDDPAYQHMQIPITLSKAPRVAVTAAPERIELVGSDSRLIRLRGKGEQAVRVQTAVADHPAVTCTWAAGPGNDATLKIRLNAAMLTANTAVTVRVQMATPTGAMLTIAVDARKE